MRMLSEAASSLARIEKVEVEAVCPDQLHAIQSALGTLDQRLGLNAGAQFSTRYPTRLQMLAVRKPTKSR